MAIYIFLTIFFVLFAYFSWKKPDFAVALIVFALPSYLIRFKIGSVPLTFLEIMILILFFAWLIKVLAKKGFSTVTFSKYKYLILLFIITASIAVLVSDNRIAAFGIWKAYFLEPILFFIVLINTIRSKRQWNLIITAIGFSALVVAILAVVQQFTGWGIPNELWRDAATRRVTSIFGYPNAVGLYLAPIAVLFFGKLLMEFSKKKKVFSKILFYLLVIILGLLAMVFAESEGALLGAGGGIVFILLARVLAERLRDKEINFKRKLIILLILIISLLAISQFKTYIIEKATLSDHSGQIRQQMWRETWQMLTDGREITGAGLANYQNSIEKYHQSGIYIRNDDPDFDEKIRISLEYQQANWQPIEIYLYPHNIILNFWSEIGMFGLLVFILLNLKMLLNYRKVKNAENKEFYFVLIAVLLAIWVHGLVDVPYFKNDLSVFFWLIFGMSVVLARSRKSLE